MNSYSNFLFAYETIFLCEIEIITPSITCIITSRDRPKSAPYPRLKNSKKTSKCQVLFYSTRKSKFFEKKIFEKITQKMDKKSHNAEKNWKGGPFGIFQHPFCRKTSKKCRGDPLGKNFIFRKKSLAVPKKKWKGGVFGLPRYGMVRGKTGKTFLVQFARPNSAFWCNNIL